MKRTLGGQPRDYQPSFERTPTFTRPPEGRKRINGLQLDSLAQPIPVQGRASLSLAQVLTMYEQRAQDPVNIAALRAIGPLDRDDDVSTLNNERAQAAADLLLSLAQAPLLQRLATRWPMPYVLNLDLGGDPHAHTLERKLQSIEQLKGLWPADTPVCLQFPTALNDDLRRLLGFIVQTARLSVTLRVDEGAGAMPLHALAAALNDRQYQLPLEALALQLGPNSQGLLSLLCDGERQQGVAAKVLRFELLPWIRHSQAGADPRDPRERTMVALTASSRAKELDLSSASIPGPLARELVATRTAWDALHLHRAAETQQLLLEGRHTVARLELYPPAHTKLRLTAEFLHLVQTIKLKVLVIHGMLDLPASVPALQQYMAAQQTQTLLESLEACFVVGHQVDIEPILQSLQGQRWIASITHKPMARQVSGYNQLAPHHAQRLATGASLPPPLMPSPGENLLNDAWPSAVRQLARLLEPDSSWADLVQGLKTPPSWVIPSSDIGHLPIPQDAGPGLLQAKVQALKTTQVPRALLNGALSHVLHDRPNLAGDLCVALILCQWPNQALTPEAWNTLAAPYKRQPWWGSEAAVSIPAAVGDASIATALTTPDAAPPVRVDDPAQLNRAAQRRHKLELQETPPPMAELLLPAGAVDIVQTVRRTLVAQAARLRGDLRNRLALEALNLIDGWLRSGLVARGALQGALRHEIALQLLQAGQWKLLRHILPTHLDWVFSVSTPEQAAALQHLQPPPLCTCTLEITAALNEDSLKAVSAFMARLPEGKRVLRAVTRPGDGSEVWRSRGELVKRTPGISLWMTDRAPETAQAPLSPAPAWLDLHWLEHDVSTFFQSLHNARLHELRIDGIQLGSAGLLKAVKQAISSTGMQALVLGDCHDALARATLTCRPWQRIEVQASAPVAQVFADGHVTAQALTVRLPASGDIQRRTESMLGACQKLEEAEILDGHFDVMHLARVLERNPTLHKVRAAVSAVNKAQANAALSRLHAHRGLTEIEFLDIEPRKGVLPLSAADRNRLLELSLTNRMRTQRNLAEGAIAAWAAHLVADSPQRFKAYLRPFDDLGHLIAPGVDGPTSRALSIVNRAGYARARPTWVAHMRQVQALLKPDVSYASFVQHLPDHVASWASVGAVPPRPVVLRQMDASLMVLKVRELRESHISIEAIVEAIGALLIEAPQATPELLEALAYLHVLPAADWLEQVLGVVSRSA